MGQNTYRITDPESGLTIDVSGPAPPSEAVLKQMFAEARQSAPMPEDTPSVMESTASRVGRTVGDALPTIGGMAGGLAGSPGGPVVAAGLSALGGAAGELGRQGINVLRGKEAQTGMAAARDAALAGLGQGAAEVIGTGASKVLSSGGRAVYRGYLKPSLSKQLAPRAEQIVTTAIEEGLPISQSGVETGKRIISELRADVEKILERSDKAIDLKTVANHVRSFAKRKYYKPGSDMGDFNAAMAVADRLDAHPSQMVPGPQIEKTVTSAIVDESGTPYTTKKMVAGPDVANTTATMVKADEAKRALDTAITETQFGVTSGAKKTTEKVARHELNEQMRAATPAIKPLNIRESRLIDATKAIAKAVGREANTNQITGWRSMVSGAAAATGGTMGGMDPQMAMAMGILLRGGLQPPVASRVAMTAVRASKQLGLGVTEATRLALMALQSTDEPE